MRSKEYKLIKCCRLCQGNLKQIINFGNVAIGNNLVKNFSKAKKVKKYPLSINNCSKCNHYQLGASIDPKILYAKNYTYLSGIGLSFLEHFENYSNWLIKKINFKSKDYILDIGSNDGTCLSFFKKKGIKTIGIDPAKLAAKIANKNGIKTINKFFNLDTKKLIEKKYGKPFTITSHNVLAHIDNFEQTLNLIYELLKDDGYLCFEVGYFKNVIESNFFDTIYHEHLDYHHANPLVKILNRLGFSVIDITTNKIQGGSIRFLSKKSKNVKNTKKVIRFCVFEKQSVLYNKKFIKKSFKGFFDNSEKIKKFFHSESNKKIIGYGAPTKSVLLNQIIGIDHNLIKYTMEDNPLKTNKYLPTSGIKIKKVQRNLNKIDYIFVYAWNFSSDIILKLKKNINKSCFRPRIIIPLPRFIIKKI